MGNVETHDSDDTRHFANLDIAILVFQKLNTIKNNNLVLCIAS